MECDFCSNPEVVRRYECMDFDASSKEAGVLYDGTRTTIGPTDLILKSRSFWAACAVCARLVDEKDMDGLIGHVVAVYRGRGNRIDAKFIQHVRYIYEEFFKNRIRVAVE